MSILKNVRNGFLSFIGYRPIRVYLGGTIFLVDYRKESREIVSNLSDKKIFDYNYKSIEILDPLVMVEPNISNIVVNSIEDASRAKNKIYSKKEINLIVKNDISLIKNCDILIAYIEKPTYGTIMEICYAKQFKKKVYVINQKNDLWNDIWLNHHTDKFFVETRDCFNFIHNKCLI